MDLLKSQIDRIQRQLSGLTASQRMLVGSLVAIMVLTLVWWGRYAGEPEMEPVLDQKFSQEEVARVTSELTSHGIRYTVSGDRILVPADRKIEALAALSYSHALPRDTKAGFDEMVGKMSPWESAEKSQMMFNRGKEMTLAQIIRDFPNVANADVMIDPTRERHIQGSIEPSATITITMQSGSPAPPKLVEAAADVVQGAISGIPRSKIKVVVDGVPARVHDAQGEDVASAGNDQLEIIQKNEVYVSRKIQQQLAYINGLMVSVTVKLNTTEVQEQRKDYDPKNSSQKLLQEKSETEETPAPPASAGEPGVASNAGLALPGAAPVAAVSGPGSTHEKTESSFQNFMPESTRSSKTPAGDVTVVGATVRVPTSYFATIYQHQSGTTKEPTDKELAPLIEAELPKIRNDVLFCTGLHSPKDLAVETYTDFAPVAPAAAQISPLSLSGAVGGHAREIALGGLAALSLFMVSMMVRKASPAVSIAPSTSGGGGAAMVMPDEDPIGEAQEGASLLDGMELDEDSIRSQQMLDQVSTLVKENPDAAATLVKRWLNRA